MATAKPLSSSYMGNSAYDVIRNVCPCASPVYRMYRCPPTAELAQNPVATTPRGITTLVYDHWTILRRSPHAVPNALLLGQWDLNALCEFVMCVVQVSVLFRVTPRYLTDGNQRSVI